MQHSGSGSSASRVWQGAPRVWTSLGLLADALVTCVPIYAHWLSGGVEDVYRFGMPLLWAGLAFAATRSAGRTTFLVLLIGLFGVSLGLALARIVGSKPLDILGLSATMPKGAAVDKIFSEVIPVCAALFLAARWARLSLEALGLRGGRVWRSLGLGLLVTIPLLALYAVDPSGSSKAVLALPESTLRAWFPWMVAFSIANGFMEELWYRGLWLTAFEQTLGPSAAMHVTSVAFCLMHVIVYWGEPMAVVMLTPVWLYMGYAYAVIVRKTGSLWGAVLAHAIADVMFMYIYFTQG